MHNKVKLFCLASLVLCLLSLVAPAQSQQTPNLKLSVPDLHTFNWAPLINGNFSALDQYLSGIKQIPGLNIGGTTTVQNLVINGTCMGCSGSFSGNASSIQGNAVAQGIPLVGQTYVWAGGIFNLSNVLTNFSIAALPPWLTGSVANATSTPALTITSSTTIPANQVLASPDGTTGGLTTRSLVSGDIPPTNLSASGNGGVTGNLQPANIGGGTNCNSTTFVRGDATCQPVATGGISSSTAGNPVIASGGATGSSSPSYVDAYALWVKNGSVIPSNNSYICSAINAAFLTAGASGGKGIVVDARGFNSPTGYYCSASDAFTMLSNCQAGYVQLGATGIAIDLVAGQPGITFPTTRCGGIKGIGRGDTGAPGTSIIACYDTNLPVTGCHNPNTNGGVRNWTLSSLGAPGGTGNRYQQVTFVCNTIDNPKTDSNSNWASTCPHGGEMIQLTLTNSIAGLSHFAFRVCFHTSGYYPQDQYDANCPADPVTSTSHSGTTTLYIVNPGGQACASACGAITAGTPLIRMGDIPNLAFGFRIENLNVDGEWVPGVVDVENTFCQEQCGLHHVKLTGFQFAGFQTYSIQSQFAMHEDWEVYQGPTNARNVCTNGTVGVFVGGGGGNLSFRRISIAADHCGGSSSTVAADNKAAAGFLLDASRIHISDSHSEGTTVGIEIGSGLYAFGNHIDGWSAANSFPDVSGIDISSNFGSGNPYSTANDLLESIHGANTGNTINDNIHSNTYTDIDISQYVCGLITACSVIR